MPDHRPRYCYACGGALVERFIHNAKRLVCPDCGTVSYMNSKPCVAAFVLRDGQLLLTRRGIEPYYGYWDIPGGFLDYGEAPEDGLRRELQEELGLDVEIDAIFDIVPDTYGQGGVAILAILYRCTTLHEPAYCADDVVDYRWFPLDQLPENIAFESSQTALSRLLATVDDRG